MIHIGGDLHANDEQPLTEACKYSGSLEIIDYMIKSAVELTGRPININTKDSLALRYAVDYNYTKVVAYLITHGIPLTAHNRNMLLTVATWNGNLEMARILIDNGSNVNQNGGSPLINAIETGNFDMIELLLSRGAGVHIDNEAPLMIAAKKGRTDIVKLLIKHGANIHARKDKILEYANDYQTLRHYLLLIGDFYPQPNIKILK